MEIRGIPCTPIPNVFFDEIAPSLKIGALRIMIALYFSVNRPKESIHLRFLSEKTGLKKRTIISSLKSLIEKNMVVRNIKDVPGRNLSGHKKNKKIYYSLGEAVPPAWSMDSEDTMEK